MEPLSTTAVAAAKTLAETRLVEANALKNAIENNTVAPLGIVASTTLADIQFQCPEVAKSPIAETGDISEQRIIEPTKEIANVEYAGLLNGMLDQEANLAGWGGEVGRYYDAAAEKTAALYDLGETKVGELLEESGIKEAVQLGLQDSIQWIETTTGKDIFSDAREIPGTADMVVVFNPDQGLSDATDQLEKVGTDVTIAVGMKDLATFEQSILQWCDEKGLLLTAKRVDFQVESEVGTEYVKGIAAEMPLVGGLANIACKHQLDVDLVTEDYEQLATDAVNVGLVVTVTASAFLLPIAAVPAGIGAFTLKSALIGGSIGAIHGGLQNGAVSVIRGEATSEVLASTGKGMLTGAALGAIGGGIGGAVLYRAGASLPGFIGAGTASGSATGGIASGAGELVNTGDLSTALKSAGSGALAGGVFGGLAGAAGHGIGRLTSKIRPLPEFPAGLDQPEGLMIKVGGRSPDLQYGSQEVQPGYHRHHVKPISLGGMDTADNIKMVPVKIHRQPHPPLAVREAPTGTIFFNK